MKKFAFVDGNRAINENNVEKHVESLKEFGKNLVPLLYVDATEVGNRKIFDAITDEEVKPELYGDYNVVLDGQHRFRAAMRLADSDEANGFTLDNLKWEKVELNGKSFEDILIEVNPGWHLQNEETGEDRVSLASAIPFPIILYGADIQSEQVNTPVTTDRIAPTLSRAIRIRAPNACSSEPLF